MAKVGQGRAIHNRTSGSRSRCPGGSGGPCRNTRPGKTRTETGRRHPVRLLRRWLEQPSTHPSKPGPTDIDRTILAPRPSDGRTIPDAAMSFRLRCPSRVSSAPAATEHVASFACVTRAWGCGKARSRMVGALTRAIVEVSRGRARSIAAGLPPSGYRKRAVMPAQTPRSVRITMAATIAFSWRFRSRRLGVHHGLRALPPWSTRRAARTASSSSRHRLRFAATNAVRTCVASPVRSGSTLRRARSRGPLVSAQSGARAPGGLPRSPTCVAGRAASHLRRTGHHDRRRRVQGVLARASWTHLTTVGRQRVCARASPVRRFQVRGWFPGRRCRSTRPKRWPMRRKSASSCRSQCVGQGPCHPLPTWPWGQVTCRWSKSIRKSSRPRPSFLRCWWVGLPGSGPETVIRCSRAARSRWTR
jgi:hypothetical protein